jgi:hypothetical protein
VVDAAPRIDARLRRLVRRLARRGASSAEVNRAVGSYAWTIGLARPSYEQIRVLANDARLEHMARVATVELVRDVYFGARPVSDLQGLFRE